MSVLKQLRKCFLLIDAVIPFFPLFYLMTLCCHGNKLVPLKKKNISKTSQIIVNIEQTLMEGKANTDECALLKFSQDFSTFNRMNCT